MIYGGQSVTGVGFLRVLRFPLSIIIPTTAPYSLTLYTRRLDPDGVIKIQKKSHKMQPKQKSRTEVEK
jgi:hypothetical protein